MLLVPMATAVVLAHNGEPPIPPPPFVLPPPLVKDYIPPRWTWEHWWEANREQYVFEDRTEGASRHDRIAAPYQKVLDNTRGVAIEGLQNLLKDTDPEVRAYAAFAIGQGHFHELRTDVAKLINDKHPAPARAAYLALGLLGGKQGRDALIGVDYESKTLARTCAAVLGCIWLEKPDGALSGGLTRLVAQTDDALMRFPCWVLGHHPDDQTSGILRTILLGNSAYQAVCLAALSAGRRPDAAARPLLRDIVAGNGITRSLAAWEADRRTIQTQGGGPGNTVLHLDPKTGAFIEVRVIYPKGLDKAHLAQIRGSAAIALGLANDAGAESALIAAIEEEESLYTPLFQGFACITLGRVGGPNAVACLQAVLEDTKLDKGIPNDRDGALNPVRGYAAIALGLYARRVNTVSGPPSNAKAATAALLNALADEQETVEVRSSAAVALGLAGQRDAVPVLRRIVNRALEGTVAPKLVGYSLVALAMLADDEKYVIRTADSLLRKIKQYQTLDDFLAGRALALAIGLTRSGGELTHDALRRAMHGMYYVRREAIIGIVLCRQGSLLQEIIPMFGGDVSDKIFAAQAVGQLYDPDHVAGRPSRARLLLEDLNFQVRDDVMLCYSIHVNEFFHPFVYVFGDDWK